MTLEFRNSEILELLEEKLLDYPGVLRVVEVDTMEANGIHYDIFVPVTTMKAKEEVQNRLSKLSLSLNVSVGLLEPTSELSSEPNETTGPESPSL